MQKNKDKNPRNGVKLYTRNTNVTQAKQYITVKNTKKHKEHLRKSHRRKELYYIIAHPSHSISNKRELRRDTTLRNIKYKYFTFEEKHYVLASKQQQVHANTYKTLKL